MRFKVFTDKKFRIPRIWSNSELKKIAKHFKGDIIDVSAWNDKDKEGSTYRDYFVNASSYTISNYKAESRGLQGIDGEIFLDLTKTLPSDLMNKFDVVFNHTTLEHIFEVENAFKNLCLMSKNYVIVVVPFLQEMHASYGDYWRFTPLAIKELFKKNGFETAYLSFNEDKKTSIYIFAVGTKKKETEGFANDFNYGAKKDFLCSFDGFTGCRSIPNSIIYRLYRRIGKLIFGKRNIKS